MKDLSKLLGFLVKVLLVAVGIEFAAIYLFMDRGEAVQPGMRIEREWQTSESLLSISSPSDPMETFELLEEITRAEYALSGKTWKDDGEDVEIEESPASKVLSKAEEKQLAVQEEQVSRERIVMHKVRRGETLTSIARAYDLDVNTILTSNELKDPNKLKVGFVLKILPKKGFTYTVKKGDTLWKIARTFNTGWKAIMAHNGLESETLNSGQKLIIPWTQDSAQRRKELEFERKNRFFYPMKSRITSGFGWRLHPIYKRRILHAGVDFAAKTGSSVKAARSGRITFAGWMNGYGKIVIIKHKSSFTTRYAHLSRVSVKKGDYVTAGKIIGKSGSTGQVTGPHLHFEIRKKGKAIDPLPYLRGKKMLAKSGGSSQSI